jgi:hypothetical protein
MEVALGTHDLQPACLERLEMGSARDEMDVDAGECESSAEVATHSPCSVYGQPHMDLLANDAKDHRAAPDSLGPSTARISRLFPDGRSTPLLLIVDALAYGIGPSEVQSDLVSPSRGPRRYATALCAPSG